MGQATAQTIYDYQRVLGEVWNNPHGGWSAAKADALAEWLEIEATRRYPSWRETLAFAKRMRAEARHIRAFPEVYRGAVQSMEFWRRFVAHPSHGEFIEIAMAAMDDPYVAAESFAAQRSQT